MPRTKKAAQAGSHDPDQSYFDGMEPKRFKELDKMVAEFVCEKQMAKEGKERMDLLKTDIAEFMFDHDLRTYICGEVGLDLEELTKARFRKVRIKGANAAEPDEDDDEDDDDGDE